MEREDFDVHIQSMIKNLIHDQVAYNIKYREKFNNIRDTHDYLKEEIEEIREALVEVEEEEQSIWKLIRQNAGEENILFRLEVLEMFAQKVLIEALHVTAVARKAIIQLDKEKAPLGGNQSDAH